MSVLAKFSIASLCIFYTHLALASASDRTAVCSNLFVENASPTSTLALDSGEAITIRLENLRDIGYVRGITDNNPRSRELFCQCRYGAGTCYSGNATIQCGADMVITYIPDPDLNNFQFFGVDYQAFPKEKIGCGLRDSNGNYAYTYNVAFDSSTPAAELQWDPTSIEILAEVGTSSSFTMSISNVSNNDATNVFYNLDDSFSYKGGELSRHRGILFFYFGCQFKLRCYPRI